MKAIGREKELREGSNKRETVNVKTNKEEAASKNLGGTKKGIRPQRGKICFLKGTDNSEGHEKGHEAPGERKQVDIWIEK